MGIRERIEGLEAILAASPQFVTREDRINFNVTLMERRAIPFPPLDDIDIRATAELWEDHPSGAYHAGFITRRGTIRSAAELADDNSPAMTTNEQRAAHAG